MAIQIVRVATGVRDVGGNQTGDAVAVADAGNSGALTEGIYRIIATSNSVVRIGTGTSASGGEIWPSGHHEYRWVSTNQIISCAAG